MAEFPEPVRKRVKKKADYCCCICRDRVPTQVHHIVPPEEGGPDTEDNAAPLCGTHHDMYGGNPKRRKWLREVRNQWYAMVEEQRARNAEFKELCQRLDKAATKDDLTEWCQKLGGAVLRLTHLNEIVVARLADSVGPEAVQSVQDAWQRGSVDLSNLGTTASSCLTYCETAWQAVEASDAVVGMTPMCPQCGAGVSSGLLRCPACGSPLGDQRP